MTTHTLTVRWRDGGEGVQPMSDATNNPRIVRINGKGAKE